jgi:hypothetical protein
MKDKRHINNWKTFNEGLFSGIKKGVSDMYNFYKLVKLLRGWERKYTPEQYDMVISSAFNLINKHDLQPGKLSPPFTLPNTQLGEEFIKKFFKAAKDNGYEVVSKPSEKQGHTTFNFTR